MNDPKILSEKTLFNKDWIKVILAKIQFPNGKTAEWDYVEFGDVVSIVAVDKEKHVYLVKEWRAPWQKQVIQIPGGGCSATTEAGRIQQARHELMEEIGFDCKNIIRLCPALIFGRLKFRFHIYLATELFESKKQGDEHEYLDVIKMPLDDAIKLFTTKEETTAATLAGLLLAKEKII